MSAVLTWAAFDIVECELGDSRVELHEKGQRLANSSCTAQYGNFGSL